MPEYFMKFITNLPVWWLWIFWIVTPLLWALLWAFLLFKITYWIFALIHTDPV